MSSEKNNPVLSPATGKVVIKRVFDAPAERVFDAWLDPAAAARWLYATPDGKMVRVEIDARVGGNYTITEQRGDLAAAHVGTYLEIDRPRRLVFEFRVPHASELTSRVTVVIAPRGAGCELTLTHEGLPLEFVGKVNGGWNTCFDNLGAVTADPREIVATRVFKAPQEIVWRAFTEPHQVEQWWGPRGFTTTTEVMDVRPGGVWKHVMHGPDGTDYPNQCVFIEVVKPERIVFSNAGGKLGEPGANFVSTWTFAAVGEETRVIIRMRFATVEDCARIAREFGAIEGAKQTLSRLAEHLPKMGGGHSVNKCGE
jgi:uncharacterized protein YndB with AHSA1/START domain